MLAATRALALLFANLAVHTPHVLAAETCNTGEQLGGNGNCATCAPVTKTWVCTGCHLNDDTITALNVVYTPGTVGSNGACPSQQGYTPITSLSDCEAAATAQGVSAPIGETDSGFPKGCYFMSDDSSAFNSHASGRGYSLATPLCTGQQVKETLLSYQNVTGHSFATCIAHPKCKAGQMLSGSSKVKPETCVTCPVNTYRSDADLHQVS